MVTIHENNATSFGTLGLGTILPSFCVVSEELNGQYVLKLEHPLDAADKWKRIERGRIVYASTPNGKQPFRIYNIKPSMGGITVTAKHIFYDLLDNQCAPISFSGTADECLDVLTGSFAYEMPFVFDTNISISGVLKTGRMNPIQAMLSDDEDMTSFVKGFGGELMRDGFHISMQTSIGQNRDVAIRYGKNLMGLEVTEDDSEVKTRIICYGKSDNVEAVDSPYIDYYPYPKIHPLEGSGKTLAVLKKEAETLLANGIDLPLVNIKVDFVELSKTAEYAEYSTLEKVYLGDIVSIINEKMNFSKKARVISYEWDSLLEKYNSVELGDFMPTLISSVTSGVKSGSLASAAAFNASEVMALIQAHLNDHNNPHQVTKEQLGI